MIRGLLAALLLAAPASAQNLLVNAFVEAEPMVGTRVDVATTTGTLSTIEWTRAVEVRVRVPDGRPLTEAERAAVRAQSVACTDGEPRGATAATEFNGTFVVRFQCAWLQATGPRAGR